MKSTITVVSYEQSTDKFTVETVTTVREEIDAELFATYFELHTKPGCFLTDREAAFAKLYRDHFHEEPTDLVDASTSY